MKRGVISTLLSINSLLLFNNYTDSKNVISIEKRVFNNVNNVNNDLDYYFQEIDCFFYDYLFIDNKYDFSIFLSSGRCLSKIAYEGRKFLNPELDSEVISFIDILNINYTKKNYYSYTYNLEVIYKDNINSLYFKTNVILYDVIKVEENINYYNLDNNDFISFGYSTSYEKFCSSFIKNYDQESIRELFRKCNLECIIVDKNKGEIESISLSNYKKFDNSLKSHFINSGDLTDNLFKVCIRFTQNIDNIYYNYKSDIIKEINVKLFDDISPTLNSEYNSFKLDKVENLDLKRYFKAIDEMDGELENIKLEKDEYSYYVKVEDSNNNIAIKRIEIEENEIFEDVVVLNNNILELNSKKLYQIKTFENILNYLNGKEISDLNLNNYLDNFSKECETSITYKINNEEKEIKLKLVNKGNLESEINDDDNLETTKNSFILFFEKIGNWFKGVFTKFKWNCFITNEEWEEKYK